MLPDCKSTISYGESESSEGRISSPLLSSTGAFERVVTAPDVEYPTAVWSPQQITDEAPAASSKIPHVELVECSITICFAVNPEGTDIVCGVLYAVVVLEPCPNEPDSSTPQHSIVFSTIAHA